MTAREARAITMMSVSEAKRRSRRRIPIEIKRTEHYQAEERRLCETIEEGIRYAVNHGDYQYETNRYHICDINMSNLHEFGTSEWDWKVGLCQKIMEKYKELGYDVTYYYNMNHITFKVSWF